MSKVSIVATITAKDGRGDDIVAAFEGARGAIEAESGTLIYTLHRNAADPNVFYVTEVYEDQAALDAHMTGPGMAALAGIADAVAENGVSLQFAAPVVQLAG
jgi:quinol monooxygenase YgiN